ncbi:MAG TPA: metallophosphatase domain-containing protein [Patescibacteria group bacterium]|nr:metallophosphatase domain-containing protein [Patescibacteria group bacterium]
MKIVTISDTHNKHNLIKVPDGDMILFAGDCSGRGTFEEVVKFTEWFGNLPHTYKIFCAGNHDWGFEKYPQSFEDLCKKNNIIYLNNTSIVIEGIKIHGSASTPIFCDWAFNRSRTIEDANKGRAKALGQTFIGDDWDKIPIDTDILITHGPPYGILDETVRGDLCGCELLLDTVMRNNIKMHVFGHIHEARGTKWEGLCLFVNASVLDEYYSPRKEGALVFDWEKVLDKTHKA